MLKIVPFWHQQLGSLPSEFITAVGPCFSVPLAGDTPLFTGRVALRPSGSAPTDFPKATLPVTELILSANVAGSGPFPYRELLKSLW